MILRAIDGGHLYCATVASPRVQQDSNLRPLGSLAAKWLLSLAKSIPYNARYFDLQSQKASTDFCRVQESYDLATPVTPSFCDLRAASAFYMLHIKPSHSDYVDFSSDSFIYLWAPPLTVTAISNPAIAFATSL